MLRKNNKGFTLAELLIVVAIIGVLVAIAIPVFNSQLRKARVATDQANVRSAKAAAAAEYMSDGESGSVSYLYDGGHVVPVNASNVSQLSSITSASGYGKSNAEDNDREQTGARGTPKKSYVEVTINDSGQITAMWVAGAAIFESTTGDLLLTGNVISNGSIMDQIKAMGVAPSTIKRIEASEGSKIDDQTEKVFSGLSSLEKIDLSKATLVSSSQFMFSDMPKNVKEIVLPQCDKPYNIDGIWYYQDGTTLASSGSPALKGKGTRILEGHSGATIYSYNPKK